LDQALNPIVRRIPVRGIELSIREWTGSGKPFLLVHGLASNARTWDRVARRLSAAGHDAVAVDQRGHGLSDKPDAGYGFEDVTADLKALIEALAMERPIIAGQSWGGNVVMAFAAAYPELTSGLVLVDGGFIDLSAAPGATWDSVAQNLRPPDLSGRSAHDLRQWMRDAHPHWDDEQIEMQFGNLEVLPDGSVRRRLSLDNHMQILRAMWEQKPSSLYGRIKAPVLIAVADSRDPERRRRRLEEIERAVQILPRAQMRYFPGADHDIHVDQPDALANWVVAALSEGFFA